MAPLTTAGRSKAVPHRQRSHRRTHRFHFHRRSHRHHHPRHPTSRSIPTHAGETPSTITIHGSYVHDGNWLVFLAAGSDDCVGASRKRQSQGGRVSNGALTIALSKPDAYKVCHSASRLPTTDSHFHFINDASLIVVASSPPSPSFTLTTSDGGLTNEAKIAIIAGATSGLFSIIAALLVGSCWCSRKTAAQRIERRIATRGLLQSGRKGTVEVHMGRLGAQVSTSPQPSVRELADAIAKAMEEKGAA